MSFVQPSIIILRRNHRHSIWRASAFISHQHPLLLSSSSSSSSSLLSRHRRHRPGARTTIGNSNPVSSYELMAMTPRAMTTTASAAVIDVGTQLGHKSGTPWRVTSTPTFSILGIGSSDAITFYHSPATSLRGLCVKTDEPLCSLHIVLATESNGGGGNGAGDDGDTPPSGDDGLPHCLEHLVFLGSRSHPHKGVLDKLANRCLADGTNAWTATDHTAYTLSTAGSEGAINLLPIFADHVLFPTLTDSGFLTEIHHVNGKGEDKGVVYCEMQVRMYFI